MSERRFKFYAVNVFDLAGRDGLGRIMLLVRPLLSEEVIDHCEGDAWDAAGLLVKESITPERMAAVLTLLRRDARAGKARLRIYGSDNKKTHHWTRIDGGEIRDLGGPGGEDFEGEDFE